MIYGKTQLTILGAFSSKLVLEGPLLKVQYSREAGNVVLLRGACPVRTVRVDTHK